MEIGVQHYYVEVTSKDGLQYGLQAFGEEAIALQRNHEYSWKENLIT